MYNVLVLIILISIRKLVPIIGKCYYKIEIIDRYYQLFYILYMYTIMETSCLGTTEKFWVNYYISKTLYLNKTFLQII